MFVMPAWPAFQPNPLRYSVEYSDMIDVESTRLGIIQLAMEGSMRRGKEMIEIGKVNAIKPKTKSY